MVDKPETIQLAVHAVFPGLTPVIELPSPNLTARAVLYPVVDSELSFDQFDALSAAAAADGDQSYYLSQWERFADADVQQDFVAAISDFGEYRAHRPPGLEYVLVSPRRGWGLLILDEGAGILAGSESFISNVYRKLPSPADQVASFVRDIRSTDHAGMNDWLDRLLRGLFGDVKARVFLEGR